MTTRPNRICLNCLEHIDDDLDSHMAICPKSPFGDHHRLYEPRPYTKSKEDQNDNRE